MTQRYGVSRCCWKNGAPRLAGHKVAANLQQVKKCSICKVQKEIAAKWDVFVWCICVDINMHTCICTCRFLCICLYHLPSLHLILRIHPVSMSTRLASAGPTRIHTVWILLISCYCVCYCVTSWLQLGNLLITMGEFYSGAETNKLRVKLDYRGQIMMGDIFLLLPKRKINTLKLTQGLQPGNWTQT